MVEVVPVEQPDVSFVSVTYGSGDVILDCIDSVVRSTSDDDLSIEFIVVDNPIDADYGRTGRSLELSTAGVLLVSPDRNLGFAGGCELGALHARGEVLAFVNPDLLAEGPWLRPLLDDLDRRGVSIAVPVLVNADGSVQEAGSRLFADGSTAPITDLNNIDDADYASAACWLIRREEHERVGGFDPDFFPAFYEDVELAIRVDDLGGRLAVDPAARIVHLRGAGTLGGSTTHDVSRQRDLLLERRPDVRWRKPPR